MEWKIVDTEKASKLHIGLTSPDEKGFLVIYVSYIPSGMSIEDYIHWIQNEKIVYLDSYQYEKEHEDSIKRLLF